MRRTDRHGLGHGFIVSRHGPSSGRASIHAAPPGPRPPVVTARTVRLPARLPARSLPASVCSGSVGPMRRRRARTLSPPRLKPPTPLLPGGGGPWQRRAGRWVGCGAGPAASAGNAAVSAADGREARSPGEQAVTEIDAALQGDAPGRAGDRHRREGAEGGQGGRRAGRSGGTEAAGVRARGDQDRLRAGIGGAEEAGAARQAGAGGQPARQGRRQAGAKQACADRQGRRRQARHRRAAAGAAAAPPATAAPLRWPPTSSSSRRCAPTGAGRRTIRRSPGHRQASRASPRTKKAHPPAASKAKEAQDAALAADRRPRRAGQGGQGRHDGRPAGRARSTRRRSSRR